MTTGGNVSGSRTEDHRAAHEAVHAALAVKPKRSAGLFAAAAATGFAGALLWVFAVFGGEDTGLTGFFAVFASLFILTAWVMGAIAVYRLMHGVDRLVAERF